MSPYNEGEVGRWRGLSFYRGRNVQVSEMSYSYKQCMWNLFNSDFEIIFILQSLRYITVDLRDIG